MDSKTAYCMTVARRQESENPKPIVFKLQKFSNEAKLMNAASNAGTVIYKVSKIAFSPDLKETEQGKICINCNK